MRSVYRILGFALQSFWRNIWLSIITVSIIGLTLFSVSLLVLFNAFASQAVGSIEQKVDVSVFFEPDVSESQALEVQTALLSLDSVRDVTYVSPTEALERFRRKHAENPEIIASLEELDDNPLGPSLAVRASQAEQYGAIIDFLNDSEYAELIENKNFQDHELLVGRIMALTDRVIMIGYAATLLFLFIAIIIVFNTIRIAIYSHRDEIKIMKSVGASNWFIKGPFLVEGMLYAVLGLGFSLAAFYPLLSAAQPYLQGFFMDMQFDGISYFNQNFFTIFGAELAMAVVITLVSSLVAMRRYLRV